MNAKLLKACAELQYKLNMMTMPSYTEAWRKMSVLSNAKKKELEEYRKTRCYVK